MAVPIHSDLSAFNVAPLNYIWPKFNLLTMKDSATSFNAYIHSCRYFSNDKNATVEVRVYPDIVWNLQKCRLTYTPLFICISNKWFSPIKL